MNRADRRKFLKSEKIYKDTIRRDAVQISIFVVEIVPRSWLGE